MQAGLPAFPHVKGKTPDELCENVKWCAKAKSLGLGLNQLRANGSSQWGEEQYQKLKALADLKALFPENYKALKPDKSCVHADIMKAVAGILKYFATTDTDTLAAREKWAANRLRKGYARFGGTKEPAWPKEKIVKEKPITADEVLEGSDSATESDGMRRALQRDFPPPAVILHTYYIRTTSVLRTRCRLFAFLCGLR